MCPPASRHSIEFSLLKGTLLLSYLAERVYRFLVDIWRPETDTELINHRVYFSLCIQESE
ncbi:hypothetical protein Pan110_10320 [Gimesia panareensis]|nr:hypothetical protein Pan110_10320 [Gimesia panareensis]